MAIEVGKFYVWQDPHGEYSPLVRVVEIKLVSLPYMRYNWEHLSYKVEILGHGFRGNTAIAMQEPEGYCNDMEIDDNCVVHDWARPSELWDGTHYLVSAP